MKAVSKTFPLRDGICNLYPDRIELVYPGIKGWWLRQANSRKVTSVGFWYFIAAIGFLLAALLSIIIDNWFLAFFFFLFMLMSLAGSWFNRQASLRTTIWKKEIENVVFHEAVEGVSRADFRIYFKPARFVRVRKLQLPARHQNGNQVANAAFWMMKEEGLVG